MSEVEDRIVEMKFDNLLFEKKLGDTIKSLDKLRASLDMAAATKGLEKVGDATKNFNFAGIHNGLEEVSRGFLAMSTVAITVISQITSAAFNAGANIAKAFTMAPMIDGFREMETNMNSIQTILANTDSKGSTLDDVNKALQDLNEYSDKTIYNFGQMAKNIGTFTAAGVGLDQSTSAIKGIANLAAVSGSSADQASGAMYQLSQALATGTLKLIDWNSVVNAGMGGEVFKTALFETGKAMGTLKDVPMKQTFKEWEDSGHSFRESLQDGWITAEVLTNTLQGFTGDLTDAQLKSMGYNDQQIEQIQRMGKMATAAATEVKTFTQLIGTIKEAIGTTWADTFKLVIGDFAEAKTLFTGMYSTISGFISQGADVRNRMLAEWKFMGGRDILLQGFEDAFHGIASAIVPIKDAFRDIFPRMTGQRLLELTKGFAEFAKNLKIGADTADQIKRVFRGFFAVFEIGWTILKEGVGFIGDVIGMFSGVGKGVLGFAADTGDTLTKLNEALVSGGGIKKFFEDLLGFIQKPIAYLRDFRAAVEEFFNELRSGDGAADALGNVESRFGHLGSAIKKIGEVWDWLVEKTEGVRQALGDLWNYITQFFRELGDSMKAEMNQGDFEGALDIFNVAFLGGIALAIRKFLNNGLKLDFGSGIMEKISGMFDQLTGTLKAMQTELKARALMEIAIAMGVLTLSLVALSMIDSAALTKALVAMGAAFAELIGAMVAMEQLSSTVGAFKFGVLAAGMILIATAMGILSLAIKNLSSLSWSELAKGLVGVAGGLAMMVTAVNLISSDVSGMIRAGIAMIAIAVAMRILANAMQAFATMEWSEIAKGIAGVGGGLLLFVTAMNKMPTSGMVQAGVGIIAIAVGMRILANAMQAFATMEWSEIAKGLIAVGVGLGAIVLLTNTMPAGGMIGIGVGLIAVGIALNVVARAVKSLASMPLGEMSKGLGGLAAMMTVLAVGTNAMNGALPGAAAMIVVSGAMLIMANVLAQIGKLEIKELIIGLAGIAAVLAVLGGAAYLLSGVIPQMLALGVAISLLGVGFALFGAGAMLVIKAFELLGKTGRKSMEVLIELIAIFMARAPLIGIAIASVIVSAVTDLAEAAPALIKAFKVIVLELLEAVKEIVPKVAETFGVIVDEGLFMLQEKYPKIQEAGYKLLLEFLRGLRDNVEELVVVGAEIIINFLVGLTSKMDDLVEAALNLVYAFLNAIGERSDEILGAGLKLLTDLLSGISQNIGLVITEATNIIINFVAGLTQNAMRLVEAGANLLISLLFGITNNLIKVTDAVTLLIQLFLFNMGENAQKIVDAGFKVLTDLMSGISNNLYKVVELAGTIISELIRGIGEQGEKISDAGADAIIDFLDGIEDDLQRVIHKGVSVALALLEGISKNSLRFANSAADILTDFLNGLADAIRNKSGDLRDAGINVAKAIADGMTFGLASKVGDVAKAAGDLAGGAVNKAKSFLGIDSPSKVFMEIGGYMAEGMAVGITNSGDAPVKSAVEVAEEIVRNFEKSMAKAEASAPVFGDTNPVITPVLDLSKVRSAARDLDSLMAVSTLRPDVSIERARTLSVATNLQNGSDDTPVPAGPTQFNYEQNIYSPVPLSTADIYRQTKSQLVLTKEELGI